MSRSPVQQRASRIAQSVIDVSSTFENWLRNHPGSVPGDAEGIASEISSLRRRARIISRACGRPASIAIYGESQVGKSYLVSTLAKGHNALVQVRIGREERNFLTEINPAGNKESTGLVTRFSINPPPKSTDQKPIYLELLSELDIVKILVNTYFKDVKHKETVSISADEITRVLDRARTAARGPTAGHLDGDDINDLKEYMDREIFSFDRLKALTPAVWTELQKLVPRLSLDERMSVYSVLWLQEAPFTSAARVLVRALESLGHADAVIVGAEAVLPRESSIIDVETLNGFEKGDGGTVEVESISSGVQVRMARATLCALTAEVYMHLSSPPGGAIDVCDLLDFPGARARTSHDSLATGIATDGLSLFYRRGKVDFLFKRYTANQELAALLLCRRPGNQEVFDIKNTVYTWIETALGESPEKRKGQNPLFVLFTRFDELVAPKTAGGTPASTLENPIKNAFVDFFNQNISDNWPVNWDGRGVFRNCHWYRNPKASISPLFAYVDGNEDTLNPDQAERIAEFRRTFLDTDSLNRYFHDPRKAWDSVMGIMDGGVSHIAERLAATIDPAMKFQQLADRIADSSARLRVRMDALCVSDDREQERKKRLDRAQNTVIAIQQKVMPQHQFGYMIEKLQITADEIRVPIRRALNEQHVIPEAEGRPAAGGYDPNASFETIFGEKPGEVATPANGAGAPPPAIRDISDRVADLAIQLWSQHLQETVGNVSWRRRLGLNEEQAANLAEELIRIAEHKNIRSRIAGFVNANDQLGGRGRIQGVDVLMRQITDALNSFTFFLDYDRIPAEERPLLGKTGLRLFDRPLAPDEVFQVTSRRGAFNQALYDSWLFAVWTRAKEALAADTGVNFDRAANDKLKAMIVTIDSATASGGT